jgi:hypothetical protein
LTSFPLLSTDNLGYTYIGMGLERWLGKYYVQPQLSCRP